MVGATVLAAIVFVSSLAALPFYLSIFAGLRFLFGVEAALILAWLAILGFFMVLMRAGLAGMYLRMHQGRRPGIGDFGKGIARYSWRFIKGYFHLTILYAIPVLILFGWMMMRYSAYSSLIFESRWNTGLRLDFLFGNRVALDIAIAVMAVIYCSLMVWDESVVLEGAAFSVGFLRSLRFAARNLFRVFAVAVISFLILRIPNLIAGMYLQAAYPKLEPRAADIMLGPVQYFNYAFSEISLSLFWFIILLFILSPIVAYAQYLLYIPNQPFRPYAFRAGRVKPRPGILIGDSGEEPPEKIGAEPDERLPPPIHGYGEDKADILHDTSDESWTNPLSNGGGKEPDDDLLRLNG